VRGECAPGANETMREIRGICCGRGELFVLGYCFLQALKVGNCEREKVNECLIQHRQKRSKFIEAGWKPF
jgi:hypothetical protein